MDIKEKFKTFIDKQKSNLKSPTTPTKLSFDSITKEEFEGRTAVFSHENRLLTVLNDHCLTPEAEQALIDSIEPLYFETDGPDVGEHELTKYPDIADLHIINGIRSRLRKQQTVVSRRVSNLIIQKQDACNKEIATIAAAQRDLNSCVNLCMDGRAQLKQGRRHFTCSLGILASYSKKQRVSKVIESLRTIQTLQKTDEQLQILLKNEDYPGAIQLLLECQKVTATFKHFSCISQLSTKLQETLERTEDQLDGVLSKMALNFNPLLYQRLFAAYELLEKSQILMDQLHMHLTSHIHNSAFTIVLGYVELYNNSSVVSSSPFEDSPVYSKLQYSELSKNINKECFLSCFLDLSKGMWIILKNYHNIVKWHSDKFQIDSKIYIDPGENEIKLNESNQYIKQKLDHGLLRIWQDVQAKIRTFILATDLSFFKFDDFLKVLDVINILIDVGKAFCDSKSETLQDSIKKQSFSFFQSHHLTKMEELCMFIENEGWEVCPVKESFAVNQLVEFHFLTNDRILFGRTPNSSPRKEVPNRKTADLLEYLDQGNPFDVTCDDSIEEDIMTDGFSETLLTDDSDEDVIEELKQDYVEENVEDRTSSALIRKNRVRDLNKVPMLTNTTLTILRLFGKYMQMMKLLQPIAFDVQICLSQLYEYYMHSIIVLFLENGICESSISPRLRTTLQKIQDTLIASDSGDQLDHTDHKVTSPTISLDVVDQSPELLYGFPTRVVAVESLAYLSQQLESFHSHIEALMPNSKVTYLNQFYTNAVQMMGEVRHVVYSYVAARVVDYDSLLSQMGLVKWDINDLRSLHSPYVDFLIRQLQIISVRLKEISSGHPLPSVSVDALWSAVISKVNLALLDGFSNPKKCSNEGRSLMQLDYQQFIMKLESLTTVRPIPDRGLVEAYIKAYYLPDDSLVEWILANKHTYNPRQLISLSNCMNHVTKKTKQRVAQLIDNGR